MRRISVIVTAAAALLTAGTVLATAEASAAPALKSLATCSAHYANTAAWADCTGGTQKSWVRLGYNCGVGPINADHHTNWVALNPGARTTLSAECNVRVNSAWYNSRVY